MKEIVEREDYTVQDEMDFIAWISSNGTANRHGKLRNDEELDFYGTPKRARTCSQRIDFLRNYADIWKRRYKMPGGWDKNSRKAVLDYIFNIAIPTVSSLRDVQLGDLV